MFIVGVYPFRQDHPQDATDRKDGQAQGLCGGDGAHALSHVAAEILDHESADRIVGEPPADLTSPSQKLIALERAEQLADEMSQHIEDEYTALMLKHVHDWKLAENAEYLDRSPEGVAGLLRRGLKTLRETMQNSTS